MNVELFAETVKVLPSILRLPLDEIKKMYGSYEFCVTEYFNVGQYIKSLSIRFEEYNYRFVCLFDEANVCNNITLCPDSMKDIDECVIYLTNHYDYDFLKHLWIMDNCFMAINQRTGDKYNFCFFI